MNSGVVTLSVLLDETCQGVRLDRALAQSLPDLSRERVKALILEGQVRLSGGRAVTDPSAKASAGQTYEVTPPPPVAAEAVAQDIPLDVVFEDAHLIVIDKPAGMVVHPAAGNADGTLVNALLHHCAGQLSGIGGVARPGIVHRIDKDTSGLLVAAKTDKAHEGLARQFKAHSIDRRYRAIAAGRPVPPAGTVKSWIGRSGSDRKKMAVVREGQGKHAITHYSMMEPLKGATLIECRLETGRTHQVRVHMAHLGHPLLGDPLYGRARKETGAIIEALGFLRQALHAARLGFEHPVDGRTLAFDSEMPGDMQQLLRQLRV